MGIELKDGQAFGTWFTATIKMFICDKDPRKIREAVMAMLEDLNEKCGEVDDQKGSVQLCLLAPFPFLDPVLDPEYEDAEKCFGTIYDSMDGGIYSKIKTDEDRYCPEARRVGDICPDCWRKLIDGGQVNDGS